MKRLAVISSQAWSAMAFLAVTSTHAEPPKVDNLEYTRLIRERILLYSGEQISGAMKGYHAIIPLTAVPYEMVAIPGGEFLMGSPDREPHRNPDEGPQRRITVEPFWMGKYEITWAQFEPFMVTDLPREKDGRLKRIPADATLADLVSSPTTPYTEMDFGMGKGDHPAISMTHLAASKFCQWLSAQTGRYYRLPTEAEWEYACRAGSTAAYSFGDDPGKLSDYAVFWDQKGREAYERVGQRKPNAWGLYDMHGNVCEWCLDQYSETSYQRPTVYVAAQWLYPRVFRGGSWYDDAAGLRCATRYYSEPNFQVNDLDLPKSFWYLTDAQWLGFRIVRPLALPTAQEMHRAWNPGDASSLKSANEEFQKLRE